MHGEYICVTRKRFQVPRSCVFFYFAPQNIDISEMQAFPQAPDNLSTQIDATEPNLGIFCLLLNTIYLLLEWMGGDGLVNSRGLWVGYHFMWCMFVSCCSVFYSLPKVDSFGFKLQATKRLFSLSLQQKERNAADVSSDFFFCKQLLFQDYIRFWTTALISMWFPWTRCNNTHHPSSTVLIPFDLLPNDALARWKV